MLCRRASCPNPTCTPTRASLITGQYPSRHGAWSLGTKLPESVPTVGDSLHDAGYDTALIGKAHFQQLISTPEHPTLESYPLLRDLEFWKNYTMYDPSKLTVPAATPGEFDKAPPHIQATQNSICGTGESGNFLIKHRFRAERQKTPLLPYIL